MSKFLLKQLFTRQGLRQANAKFAWQRLCRSKRSSPTPQNGHNQRRTQDVWMAGANKIKRTPVVCCAVYGIVFCLLHWEGSLYYVLSDWLIFNTSSAVSQSLVNFFLSQLWLLMHHKWQLQDTADSSANTTSTSVSSDINLSILVPVSVTKPDNTFLDIYTHTHTHTHTHTTIL